MKLMRFLFGLFIAAWPALAQIRSVSVDTNGVIVAPTNLFAANSNRLNQAITTGTIDTAGRGLVKSGTTLHVGQSAAYTNGLIPYISGASTIDFAPALFYDSANGRLSIGSASSGVSLLHLGQSGLTGSNSGITIGTGFERNQFYSDGSGNAVLRFGVTAGGGSQSLTIQGMLNGSTFDAMKFRGSGIHDINNNVRFLIAGPSAIYGSDSSTNLIAITGTGNLVAATPDGSSGLASLRALVAADIPSHDASKITSGTMATARLGSGTANANTLLHGNQAYSAVAEADLSLSDNTTANVTTNAHGLLKKLPNDSAVYLDGKGNFSAVAGASGGTVTSVAMTVPSILSVSGSPITSSGTLAVTLGNTTSNKFLAGPINNGAAAAPTFRTLDISDFASGASASSSTFWRGDGTWASAGGNATNTYNTIITTNLTVLNSLTVSNISVTNITVQNNLTVSNLYTVNGSHNTLIVTNTLSLGSMTDKLLRVNAIGVVTNAGIANGSLIDFGNVISTVKIPDGSVAVPGLTFSAGGNDGLARSATATLSLISQGTEIARVANGSSGSFNGIDMVGTAGFRGASAVVTNALTPQQIGASKLAGTDSAGVLTNVTLAGDVTTTSGGLTTTIANNAVTLAKLVNATATQRVLGRNTAGSGNFEEVTSSQIHDWIGSVQGDILYRGASSWAVLAPGTSGQVLQSGGASANPSWTTAASGGQTAGFVIDGNFFIGANFTNINGSTAAATNNFLIVGGSSNATTNGLILTNAIAFANAATPRGSALAVGNRFTIFLLPGLYTVADGALVLSKEFVDLVGISPNTGSRFYNDGTIVNGDTEINSSGNTVTINATANDDITLQNLYITTSSSSKDCVVLTTTGIRQRMINILLRNSSAIGNHPMPLATSLNGYYEDVRCWNTDSFGYSGTASGVFVRCKAGDEAFEQNGTCSGVFIDCEANDGFGGNTCSGTFIRCRRVARGGSTGMFGMRSGATVSGSFYQCIGSGDTHDFGGFAGTMSGNLWYCTDTSLPAWSTVSGSIMFCDFPVSAPVNIAATGYTNSVFGRTAIVYYDGTAVTATVKNAANTPIYTNAVALSGGTVILEKGGSVILSGTSVTGRAITLR